MKTWRPTSRLRRAATVAAVACLAATAAAALTAPPAAATGTLTPTLAVSNNTAGASNVTYTWGFTTKTAGVLTSIAFTIPGAATDTTPPSVSGSTAIIYGAVGCSAGAATLGADDTTVTVSLNCGTTSTAANTPIAVTLTGVTNTSTPSTAEFDSEVTTSTSAGALDQGTVPASQTPPAGIKIASNSTTVNVIVPESLTFTNSGPSTILLLPVPAAPATNNQVQLEVATNAASGYTLSACVGSTGISDSTYSGTGTTPSIDQVTPGTPVSSLSGSAFGAKPSAVSDSSTDSTGGTGQLNSGAWAASTYSGYPATCDGSSHTDDSVVLYNTAPTGGDEVTMTNGASVSSTQAGGTYTGTITYLVTPSY